MTSELNSRKRWEERTCEIDYITTEITKSQKTERKQTEKNLNRVSGTCETIVTFMSLES